jgi:hypothetical protein
MPPWPIPITKKAKRQSVDKTKVRIQVVTGGSGEDGMQSGGSCYTNGGDESELILSLT